MHDRRLRLVLPFATLVLLVCLFPSANLLGYGDLPITNRQLSQAALTLLPETNHGLEGVYAGALATGDFDQDGRLDLVIGGNRLGMFSAEGANALHDVRLYRNISETGGNLRFALQQVR
jgi:hypothetical protein